MSIQTYYKQLKGIMSQTPLEKDRGVVENSIVQRYNKLVDDLAIEISKDLSGFKLNEGDRWNENTYEMSNFRIQLAQLIGYLEGEFELEKNISGKNDSGTGITVINNNTVAVTVTQNFSQIIENSKNEVEKQKLIELQTELEKPEKDWSKIKTILKWVLDFSEKLFFQLLPILLKHYGL